MSNRTRIAIAPLSVLAALLASAALLVVAGCPAPPVSPRLLSGDEGRIRNIRADTAILAAALASMSDATPRFTSEPVFLQIDGKDGSHAPAIAALANGESLAAWFSYRSRRELNDADIFLARRSITGEWSPPVRVVDYPWAAANPVLYAEGDDVWLFHAQTAGGWSLATSAQLRSFDGGRTWSSPQPVSTAPGSNVRFAPLRLDDGALLLPAYDDLLSRSTLLRSTDGNRWSLYAVLEPATSPRMIQPCIVRTRADEFLLVGRNMSQGAMWTGESSNGRNWQFSLGSGFPNAGAPTALLRLRTGELVMVFNDSPRDRRPLVATVSLDDGRSWAPPRVLQDAFGDWAYPVLSEAVDGDIELVYSYNRERIEYARFNLAWLLSGS